MAHSLTSYGDSFIWWTSLAAGALMLVAAYRGLARRFFKRNAELLGRWLGYAYFQDQDGPKFYRERIEIARNPWRPWQLTMTATPIARGHATIYRGVVSRSGACVICSTYEPTYDDRTLELSKLVMNDREYGQFIYGIALGKGYVDVYCATAHIWCRNSLDDAAQPGEFGEIGVETKAFDELARRVFRLDAASFQIILP